MIEGPENSAIIAGPVSDAVTRSELADFWETHKISVKTVDHDPVFTVEEGRKLKLGLTGGHSKNLFLKDKNGAKLLVVAHCDTRADLVGLGKAIGAKGRLSFGSADLLGETLGIMPGAVTPFALINKGAKSLRMLIFDRRLLEFETLWFHPLENCASTAISPGDLIRFVSLCGFNPRIVDLAAPRA